jgi:hypothetical protein
MNLVNAIVSRWNDFAAQTKVKADLRDAVGKTLNALINGTWY